MKAIGLCSSTCFVCRAMGINSTMIMINNKLKQFLIDNVNDVMCLWLLIILFNFFSLSLPFSLHVRVWYAFEWTCASTSFVLFSFVLLCLNKHWRLPFNVSSSVFVNEFYKISNKSLHSFIRSYIYRIDSSPLNVHHAEDIRISV